jgi:hypothetical protein
MDKSIEIIELREAGSDGGSLMGFYARGHHDRWAFSNACNAYTGADMQHDDRYVPTEWREKEVVRHEWWRTVPISGEPGFFRYHSAEPRSRGAFPVTVTTIVEDRQRHRTERWIEEWRKGQSRGFGDGLNWALRQLDTINPEAGDELLRRYREASHGSA